MGQTYWKDFKHKVDRGREGLNHWIPFPFDRFSKHVGITKRMYHLIGGDPGTGKSAFTHLCYITQPYNWWKNRKDETDMKLRIILRSMERSKEYTIAKWVCWRIYFKYGILLDVNDILSYGDSRLGDEEYEMVCETRDYFEQMQEHVEIIDGLDNPTGIWKHLRGWAHQNGDTFRLKGGSQPQKYIERDGGEWINIRSLPPDVEIDNRFERIYVPDDEDLLTIFIIDHIGKVRRERGYTKKENLDKMSEYIAVARDRFGFIPVVVSQFNRSLSDSTRRSRLSVAPEKQDFKGTGNTYEDCDVAMGLFNPHEYQMEEFPDHNGLPSYAIQNFVNQDGFNRFRSLHVLKNTYGIDNFDIGLNFIGEIGHFRELPRPENMTRDLYQHYTNVG
jgi:hypothetical protein